MTLRTLIADDETLARERLALLLSAHNEIEIIAQASDGDQTIALLHQYPIDLLFLDIQMPGPSGLDILQQANLPNPPAVIYVTAYHQHAIRAFELDAIDYLTKPVHPLRLSQSIQRARTRLAARQALLAQPQLTAHLTALTQKNAERPTNHILVRDGVKDTVLKLSQIEWIQAADYYSSLHSRGRTYLLRQSITQLARQLPHTHFIRIHRSTIVNLNYIREICREGPEEGTLILTTGQRLHMSKAGRQTLAIQLSAPLEKKAPTFTPNRS